MRLVDSATVAERHARLIALLAGFTSQLTYGVPCVYLSARSAQTLRLRLLLGDLVRDARLSVLQRLFYLSQMVFNLNLVLCQAIHGSQAHAIVLVLVRLLLRLVNI